jgi:multiple sugar transport system substrate-binding protein
MKKLLAVLMTLTIVLTACGGSSDLPEFPGLALIDNDDNGVLDWQEQDITLTFGVGHYSHFGDANPLYLNAEKFVEKYPNITIEYTTVPNDIEVLTAMAQEGSLPDVFQIDDPATAYDRDLTLNMEAYLLSDDDFYDIDTKVVEYMKSYDGLEYYGVPWMGLPQLVAVNTGLLKEKNIPVPGYDWTFDEYETIRSNPALTSDSQCIFPGIVQFPEIGAAYFDNLPNGWKGYNSEMRNIDLVSATGYGEWFMNVIREAKAGLHYWDLTEEQRANQCSEVTGDPFMAGVEAFSTIWTYEFGWKLPEFQNNSLEVEVYPMPIAPEGGRDTHAAYFDSIGLNSALVGEENAVKAEAAAELVKWITFKPEGLKERYALIDYYSQEKFEIFTDHDEVIEGEEDTTFGDYICEDGSIYHKDEEGNVELPEGQTCEIGIYAMDYLADFVLGYPITTNPEILALYPYGQEALFTGEFEVFNIGMFRDEATLQRLAQSTPYPRNVPGIKTTIDGFNPWDVKVQMQENGTNWENVVNDWNDLLNSQLNDYLRQYTKDGQ